MGKLKACKDINLIIIKIINITMLVLYGIIYVAVILIIFTVLSMILCIVEKITESNCVQVTELKKIKEKDIIFLQRLNIVLGIIILLFFVCRELAFEIVSFEFGGGWHIWPNVFGQILIQSFLD